MRFAQNLPLALVSSEGYAVFKAEHSEDDGNGTVVQIDRIGEWPRVEYPGLLRDFKNRPLASRQALDARVRSVTGQFERLRDLAAGWDGPGSVPVTSIAWEVAMSTLRRFLDRMPSLIPNPNIKVKLVPGSDGSVDLILRSPNRAWELTVEVPAVPIGGLWYTAEDGEAIHQGNLEVGRQFEDALSFLALRT